MSKHPSVEKRSRQNVKRQERNAARRSRVRGAERRLKQALEEKDIQAIKDKLPVYVSEMMRASSKGVLHRKVVSRKTANLSRAAHRIVKGS